MIGVYITKWGFEVETFKKALPKNTEVKTIAFTGDWIEAVRQFYSTVKEIDGHIHLALNGPSSLAFGCGVIFGSLKTFSFWHYQNGAYHEIRIDNVRALKQRLKQYNYVEPFYEEGDKNLVVMLGLSYHEIRTAVKEYVMNKLKLENSSYLEISLKDTTGNIPIELMPAVATEISSLLQDVKKHQSFDKFHFFFSCPVPIAFMVGVAFGLYDELVVYNFSGAYEPVLKFEDLTKIKNGLY